MLEGLAVWALFIYLLRLVGMPWNKFTKGFAYLGGTGWLMFVWVGLINYTPMDLSGGSLVQSPHIQLRPDSLNVKGKVTAIHIEPNQQIEKGQLIYEIDDTQYKIAVKQAHGQVQASQIAWALAKEDVDISKANHRALLQNMSTTQSQLNSAKVDLELQTSMLNRYLEQNSVVKNTITESDIDKQRSLVDVASHNVTAMQSQLDTLKIEADKALLSIDKSKLTVSSRKAELLKSEQQLEQAEWELSSTKVYAPADGFVTNFILREGQRVSTMPRLQMYTDEKYVLMRVNHQAIRNIKPGNTAEFASSVYPGHIFSAEVEGVVEATGESQSNLLGWDAKVSSTTGQNVNNKHHFVRLKIEETEGYDIPVGSVGLAWVSGDKPIGFLNFLDVIRGIIVRMKSQLYYFYSV
ncbi:biotin/lipoyl-binding protein [Vibrio astriarenae]|uniref:Biotin/lipoyl-binding protein n=1 Tax=Vibrio astriarenae TaxID=1481923 RepID=A0A7Z2T6F2_9VIBR|nr:biotin/lipoyl-binding protein [Vibrio astriarenae]QIA65187.1 biotin/lipoyl-binding protein [Vibrio astriarenae]